AAAQRLNVQPEMREAVLDHRQLLRAGDLAGKIPPAKCGGVLAAPFREDPEPAPDAGAGPPLQKDRALVQQYQPGRVLQLQGFTLARRRQFVDPAVAQRDAVPRDWAKAAGRTRSRADG